MADTPVVHIGQNSPEYIAFLLLGAIAKAEKKPFNTHESGVDRQWILDTYAECLTW